MDLREILKMFVLFFKIPIVLRGRGRVFGLGWIRIEPRTEIHHMAVKEGIIHEGTELLPHDESELEKLFYCRPSFTFFDVIIIFGFKFIEDMLKPMLKSLRDKYILKRKRGIIDTNNISLMRFNFMCGKLYFICLKEH